MFGRTIGRVIWKEYRLQRGYWLAIMSVVLLLQLWAYVLAHWNAPADPPPDHVFGLFLIGLAVPAIFALGSGAMLFAEEHEAETLGFQLALPVSSRILVGGKFVWAAVATLAMVLLGWVSARALAGGTSPVEWHGRLWVGALLAVLMAFESSVFFSLILRRVLWATVLGAVTSMLVSLTAIVTTGELLRGAGHESRFFEAVVVVCFAGAAAAFLLNLWLAGRWAGQDRCRTLPVRDSVLASTCVSALDPSWPPRCTLLAHLFWQAWRQSLPTTLILFVSLVALWIAGYLGLVLPSGRSSRLPLALLPVMATLVGSSLFWSDQRRETYAFFAERGVPARLVWLSRQGNGLLTFSAWVVFALAACAPEVARPIIDLMATRRLGGPAEVADALWALVLFLGIAALCYCAGQLASLLCRSPVIGLFFGIVGSMVLGMWASAMHSLRVPLWLSVVPLTLVCLWASWLRAPDWMDERTNWRARLRLWLSLLLPVSLVFIAFAAYRVWEIPREKVELPLPQVTRPTLKDLLKTDEVFTRCAQLEQQGRLDDAWDEYQAALRFCRRLSGCRDAIDLERRVLERLGVWASAAGQNGKRVREARIRLESEYFQPVASVTPDVVRFYWTGKSLLDLEPKAWSGISATERRWTQTVLVLFPWERQRMRRLLDLLVVIRVSESAQSETVLSSGGSISDWRPDPRRANVQRYLATNLEVLKGCLPGIPEDELSVRFEQETRRRAVLLQLALIAWRLDHGSLPERLEQLVSVELSRLPVDPYTGVSFAYMPQGLAGEVIPSASTEAMLSDRPEVPAGTPLLWSAGPNLRVFAQDSVADQGEWPAPNGSVYATRGQGVVVVGARETWERGWCFPIAPPAPEDTAKGHP